MKRRILGWALALGCAGTVFSGCELLHHEHRAKTDSEPVDESDQPPIGEVKSEAPKGFFHSTRLPGAMSSEARDIERDLGVH